MTLLRSFSGSKPQRGEDWISGSLFGLAPDPILNPRQSLGGLMDIIAFGDVGDGLEKCFEAFATVHRRAGRRRADAAARRARRRSSSVDLSHPSAFPRGVPAAVQSHFLAG